ncbi:hypothetical protein [Nocardioides zhouii]|jgi:TM2 domain-containing membrane protein YozV|uniref:Uncharacterized protein n=1 Tax=Nocardioides zhouii TaxID=1168729 RepID=A0A4Q2SJQ8_9ACTN|nr:hypothetical protein [Nocardioides zhouii]RYC05642.1 hypothetical protein EUA94_18005 [Nocardioides zhouii]
MSAKTGTRSRLLRTGTTILVWTTVALLCFLSIGGLARMSDGSTGRDVIPMASVVTTVTVLTLLMRAVVSIADDLSDGEYAAATIQLRTVSSGIVLLILTTALAVHLEPQVETSGNCSET